ncbi:hypothetical protein KM043_004962 [Ampulex compressa]|nr:hypothetical protein KM043_004962 [Ampulex compressa]
MRPGKFTRLRGTDETEGLHPRSAHLGHPLLHLPPRATPLWGPLEGRAGVENPEGEVCGGGRSRNGQNGRSQPVGGSRYHGPPVPLLDPAANFRRRTLKDIGLRDDGSYPGTLPNVIENLLYGGSRYSRPGLGAGKLALGNIERSFVERARIIASNYSAFSRTP